MILKHHSLEPEIEVIFSVIVVLYYIYSTLNHKKCDILFLTITLANLNRFL